MITKFGSLFAGHVDFEDMGFDATPVNERRLSDERLAGVFDKSEAIILKMRFGFFGEVKTLEDIGQKIGLSRERVRQIEKRAKERLKSKLQNEAWANEDE